MGETTFRSQVLPHGASSWLDWAADGVLLGCCRRPPHEATMREPSHESSGSTVEPSAASAGRRRESGVPAAGSPALGRADRPESTHSLESKAHDGRGKFPLGRGVLLILGGTPSNQSGLYSNQCGTSRRPLRTPPTERSVWRLSATRTVMAIVRSPPHRAHRVGRRALRMPFTASSRSCLDRPPANPWTSDSTRSGSWVAQVRKTRAIALRTIGD